MAARGGSVPSCVSGELRTIVASRAADYGYISRTRPENNEFITQLVNDPEVGGRLLDFMEKPKIRTYVKDTLLKFVAKVQRDRLFPSDHGSVVRRALGVGSVQIAKKEKISLHRFADDGLAVVSATTLARWDSGLRGAAEYFVGLPGFSEHTGEKRVILLIAVEHGLLTQSDRDHICKAVRLLGGVAVFTDDCEATESLADN